MTEGPEDRRSTYHKINEYRRLTRVRALAIGATAVGWVFFFTELQPANNPLAENLREQWRIMSFVLAVLAVVWTRSVIRRRHAVGADLYVVDALPPASRWPAIAASLAVAVIGAAATLLSQRGG